MDILNILKNSQKELYVEDLDFFETELATGEYDEEYILQCNKLIAKIRNWIKYDEQKLKNDKNINVLSIKNKGVVIGISDLAPKEAMPTLSNIKPDEIILNDIKTIREADLYKTNFKNYIIEKTEINADFIEKHYSFFESWELDTIISVKQLGEKFLEKYFAALNHDKIAKYQIFSEAFFMRHYSQLDVNIVLEKGKNDWRKKENRSKQLDVFLRLKGVKI